MNFSGQEIIRDRNNKPIYTKTPGQDLLVDTIRNNDIIFVNGPSGTGKTAIATWIGINGLDDGIYEHLILTRPVVSGGEELGFLPGGLDEKIAPYMQPLYDAISTIKGRREKPEEQVKQMPVLSAKEKKEKRKSKKTEEIHTSNNDFYSKVQVCPLAFIRGSTLSKSYIVCDEFQNTSIMQMKMMLTRLGKDSKMIICGDKNQCDLPARMTSGFGHAQDLLKGVPRVGFVNLGVDDIVRHKLIKEIILRYEVPDYKKNSAYKSDSASEAYYKTPTHTWERDPEGVDFDPVDDDDFDDGMDYCPECGGCGVDDYNKPCKLCGGKGLLPLTQPTEP